MSTPCIRSIRRCWPGLSSRLWRSSSSMWWTAPKNNGPRIFMTASCGHTGALGRVDEMTKEPVGNDLVDPGKARTDDEERERKEDPGEDREVEWLDQGRQEGHAHDRALGA